MYSDVSVPDAAWWAWCLADASLQAGMQPPYAGACCHHHLLFLRRVGWAAVVALPLKPFNTVLVPLFGVQTVTP